MATFSKAEVIGFWVIVLLALAGGVVLWFPLRDHFRDHFFAPYAVLDFEAPRPLDSVERATVVASLESRARPLDNRKAPRVQPTSERAFRVYIQGASAGAPLLAQWIGRAGVFEAVLQASDPARAALTVSSPDGVVPLSSDVLLRNKDIKDAFLARDKDSGDYYIALMLKHQYANRFADLTALHAGKVLVVMMDGQVIDRATLPGRIDGGRVAIHGSWRDEHGRVAAGTIVNLLRTPPLPVALTGRYVGELPAR